MSLRRALVLPFITFLFLSCDNNVRSGLRGGLPVCYGKQEPTTEDLDAVVAYFIREAQKPDQRFACGLVRGGARFSVIEDRGRIVKIKPRWADIASDAWTYRENVYNERSDKVISLIQSILAKGNPSKEGFIKPDTGQLEHCPFVRASVAKPFEPDLMCEKEVRAKGFVRADEYKARS